MSSASYLLSAKELRNARYNWFVIVVACILVVSLFLFAFLLRYLLVFTGREALDALLTSWISTSSLKNFFFKFMTYYIKLQHL